MKKNKIHKIDLIFLVGIGIITIVSLLIDIYYFGGVFPVASIVSVYYVSYPLWFILLIYSSYKYREKQDKPECVKWYMLFLLPFLQVGFLLGFMIIIGIIMHILTNLF